MDRVADGGRRTEAAFVICVVEGNCNNEYSVVTPRDVTDTYVDPAVAVAHNRLYSASTGMVVKVLFVN